MKARTNESARKALEDIEATLMLTLLLAPACAFVALPLWREGLATLGFAAVARICIAGARYLLERLRAIRG